MFLTGSMAVGEHATPAHFPQHHTLYISEQTRQVFKDTLFNPASSTYHLLTDMFALLHNVLVTVRLQEMFAETPAGDLQSSLNPW